MTFAEARALVNRPASGMWSTMEIIRESSGINWVWLRTLFKGTSFPPLDIIGDHSDGGGGEGWRGWGGVGGGLDGWRQLHVFVPVLTWRKRTCHSNGYSTFKFMLMNRTHTRSWCLQSEHHHHIISSLCTCSCGREAQKKTPRGHKCVWKQNRWTWIKIYQSVCHEVSTISALHVPLPPFIFILGWEIGKQDKSYGKQQGQL